MIWGSFNRSGYRREKTEVFPEGSGFRAYVLLRFPLAETTKITREQVTCPVSTLC